MKHIEALHMVESSSKRVEQLNKEREREQESRDQNIRDASKAGVSIADLARASGLSRTMLYKIIEKNRATG